MTKAEKEAYFRHLDNVMVQNDAYDTARTEGREEGICGLPTLAGRKEHPGSRF